MIKRNIKLELNPYEFFKVQDICLANGIFWKTETKETLVKSPCRFLYISEEISFGINVGVFKEHKFEEVSAELFIRTNGTCVEETPEQELKQNNNKEETMEKNEVESYADVKEYLIAKGLYKRVLEINWSYYEEGVFRGLFVWDKTKEGFKFWYNLNDKLTRLEIHNKIESLLQDYKAKQGKDFIKHLEAQPEEAIEAKPLEKPKQYLCYVQGKALPKHIHKTLEQAKQEAQRLCIKELAKVSVLEVVAEYEAEVLVKEVL